MKIKRIKLVNFRQFFGKNNIIEFSVDPLRNVTLIHAENGVGKTTILNSILWCFYGKFTDDFEYKNNIVNIDALASGVNECEVEVEFIHEGENYSATRKYNESTRNTTLSLFAISNGDYQPLLSDRTLLNSVIPEEMAEYFLFHGEGISQLQDDTTNFRDAIRDILGFSLAEKAIEDLNNIKKKWHAQLQKINANEKKYIRLNQDLLSLEKNLKEKLSFRNEINITISELKLTKKEVSDAIIDCKILDATDLKKDISRLEMDSNRRNIDLSRENRNRQKLINNYGWKIFGSELSKKSLDFIDTSTLSGKIPAPYDETLVNDILSMNKCICGREVSVGTAEYNTIVNLIDRANTADLRNNIIKARSFSETIGNNAKEFINEYNDINAKIKSINHEIADITARLDALNIKIDSIDDAKLKKLRTREREISNKLENSELAFSSTSREIEKLNAEIIQLKLLIDKNSPQDSTSLKLTQSIYFIEKLINACCKKLKDTEDNSKGIIKKYVDDILLNFSRKDFSVKIDSNFNFQLIRADGGIVAKSKGEKLLLNLAFVSALIKLAAKRSKAEGKFLQPGTVAPFIIDAPFGELDETYRRATAHFLPENSEQLVLLLSSSHWRGTVSDAIKNKVGREYLLISNKKSERGNKPLDEIIINERSYTQSIYESDFDGTSIWELT